MQAPPQAISLILRPQAGEHIRTDELDELTRQFLDEIRELEVESAGLLKGEVLPGGAKGADPVALGALAVAVLPPVIPKLIEFLQSWSLRGENRSVKIRAKAGDREIEVEYSPSALSGSELKKLVNTLTEALPPAGKTDQTESAGAQ